MSGYKELVNKAFETPLGRSAIGVVCILLFAMLGVVGTYQGLQIKWARDDANAFRAEFFKMMKDRDDRDDKRMENLYQNMRKTADGLNAFALATAVSFRAIEVTLHIPPSERGPMPSMPLDAPKPVELKPPPSKE